MEEEEEEVMEGEVRVTELVENSDEGQVTCPNMGVWGHKVGLHYNS